MDQCDDVVVSGALFLAFRHACINLNFFIDAETHARLQAVQPTDWYPLETFQAMLRIVAQTYADPVPILERVGSEMMQFWYEVGPGRQHIRRGVDFLRFQTSSGGYYSVIRGDPQRLGEFTLLALNEAAGTATVRSTTPFSKDMERGVLRGGLGLAQDYLYIAVDNAADPHTFLIEFH